jgi:hypothetical protein
VVVRDWAVGGGAVPRGYNCAPPRYKGIQTRWSGPPVSGGGGPDERVNYDNGSCATRNIESCFTNYRPVLSSERAPYKKKKKVNLKHKKIKIWSWALGGCPTPRQTGRMIVYHNLTLTSKLEIFYEAVWTRRAPEVNPDILLSLLSAPFSRVHNSMSVLLNKFYWNYRPRMHRLAVSIVPLQVHRRNDESRFELTDWPTTVAEDRVQYKRTWTNNWYKSVEKCFSAGSLNRLRSVRPRFLAQNDDVPASQGLPRRTYSMSSALSRGLAAWPPLQWAMRSHQWVRMGDRGDSFCYLRLQEVWRHHLSEHHQQLCLLPVPS